MPYLTIVRGPETGRVFEILGQEIWIGRSLECDIHLLDPTVSRRHCRLVREGRRLWLIEWGPANPVRIDGRIVGRCRLRSGARILLGAMELRFTSSHPLRRGGEALKGAL